MPPKLCRSTLAALCSNRAQPTGKILASGDYTREAVGCLS